MPPMQNRASLYRVRSGTHCWPSPFAVLAAVVLTTGRNTRVGNITMGFCIYAWLADCSGVSKLSRVSCYV
jgi:hypothetical protein